MRPRSVSPETMHARAKPPRRRRTPLLVASALAFTCTNTMRGPRASAARRTGAGDLQAGRPSTQSKVSAAARALLLWRVANQVPFDIRQVRAPRA